MFQKERKLIVGMLHLPPLPGAPRFNGELEDIVKVACEDALALVEGGVDAILIENFGDVPYEPRKVSMLTVASMAHVIDSIKTKITVPFGVNVQFDAFEAEIVLAYVCKAQFVRIEGFVDFLLTNTGFIAPCAAEVLRLRKRIGAEHIGIWADVQVKEAVLLRDRPLTAAAAAAAKNLADAIIVTGKETGAPPTLEELEAVKESVNVPVLVGSGLTPENAPMLLSIADGAIVGTALKTKGRVDPEKVRTLVKAVQKLCG